TSDRLDRRSRRDDGEYGRTVRGVWERPDAPVMAVTIKRVGPINNVHYPHDSFNRRLKREATIWKAIDHPNILQFLGYRAVRGALWLVTLWCQHGNLEQYITSNPGLTAVRRVQMLCGAARGLAHLHSLDPVIVHGTLQPKNVLVKDNLEVALCDIGSSRVFSAVGHRIASGYQAKEVLISWTPTATTGDVYAFGGLILATMSGKSPFWRKMTEPARIAAVCHDEIPLTKDHPLLPAADPLWNLLRECWSSEPEWRPTVENVLQTLEREMEKRLLPGNLP
ncbi:hypothetical protein FRC01_001924, partial [Tulasnella sp. 417]